MLVGLVHKLGKSGAYYHPSTYWDVGKKIKAALKLNERLLLLTALYRQEKPLVDRGIIPRVEFQPYPITSFRLAEKYDHE